MLAISARQSVLRWNRRHQRSRRGCRHPSSRKSHCDHNVRDEAKINVPVLAKENIAVCIKGDTIGHAMT